MEMFLKSGMLLLFHICICIQLNGQQITKGEYFFDKDPGYDNGTSIDVVPDSIIKNFKQTISIEKLPSGFHSLFVRLKDSNGSWSLTSWKTIYKLELPSSDTLPANLIFAEYFIDTDPGAGNGTSITIPETSSFKNIAVTVPLDKLTVGFHTIFVRIKDKNEKWSICNNRLFYKLQVQGADTLKANLAKAEYFIDTDPGMGNGKSITLPASTSAENIAFSIDMASFSNGFHSIYVRTLDDKGTWSLTNVRTIFKEENIDIASVNIVKAEYYLDKDPGKGNGVSIPVDNPAVIISNIAALVPLDTFKNGPHTITARIQDERGLWSLNYTRIFQVIDEVNSPNLVLLKTVTTPAALSPGDSLVTENTIALTAFDTYNYKYYISFDTNYNETDILLGTAALQIAPGPGPIVYLPTTSYNIPAATAGGTYNVLLVAFPTDASKPLKSKKVGAVKVAAPDQPNFLIVNGSASPYSSTPNDSLTVSCSLRNPSTVNSDGPIDVAYFISKDNLLDAQDIALGIVNVPLAPAAKITVAIKASKIKIPANTPGGLLYILFVADSKGLVKESDESDNVSAVQISIAAPKMPDFSISDAFLNPVSITAGDIIALNYVVSNIGAAPSPVSTLHYFISNDRNFDKADIGFGKAIAIPALAAGNTISTIEAQVQIPTSTSAGKKYILVVADKDLLISEVNEMNNVAPIFIRISSLPDLAVKSGIIKPSFFYPGDTAAFSCIVENTGSGGTEQSVNLQYYLSKKSFYDTSAILIGSPIPVASIVEGGSKSIALVSNVIPYNISAGNYNIIMYIDNNNMLRENDETNNVFVSSVKILGFPDLSVSKTVATPAQVLQGDSVVFSCTINNTGAENSQASTVRFYISQDQLFDNLDKPISDTISVPELAAGTSSVSISHRYKFEKTTLAGTYFVLIQSDASQTVKESDESNNVAIQQIIVGNPDLADLVILKSFVSPSVIVAGDTINLECTIKNDGINNTKIASKLKYFLSTDLLFDNSDIPLGEPVEFPIINKGDTFQIKTGKYKIPVRVKPGNYILLSFPDVNNLVNEKNELNNIGTIPLRILPFPDLTVTKAKVTDIIMYVGDSTYINSTTINASGSATKKIVNLQYFISKDQVYDASDIAISKPIAIEPLQVAQGVNQNAIRIGIPINTQGGIYYIIPYADSKNDVIETKEHNNIDAIAVTINPRPFIATPQSNDSLTVSSSQTLLQVIVTSELPLASVTFNYRKIADTLASVSKELLLTTGRYTGLIPQSDINEIGVEYYFSAVDSNGNKSKPYHGSLQVNIPSPGLIIPYNGYGRSVINYRMISVPLTLKQKRVDSTMYKSVGKYDRKKWRFFNYNGSSNIELNNGLVDFDPGLGYWLVIKDTTQVPITTGAGTTLKATTNAPYSISLKKGWNQIGNPYNIDISWDNIKFYKKNNALLIPEFYKYNGVYSPDSIKIRKMEGFFVLASENTTLYFPTQKPKFSKRVGNELISMNEKNWEVLFQLKSGEDSYNLGGLGMKENAKYSKDEYDRLTPPRFIDFLEINFLHPEYFYEKFTKDIVPSSDEYVWEMHVESENGGLKTLSWKNDFFIDNHKKLVLYDEEAEKLIDMAKVEEYVFDSREKRMLKVFYGLPSFIDDKVKPQRIVFGEAAPNPFSDKTIVTLSLPVTDLQYNLNLSVYNALGFKIATINDDDYQSGFYEFEWNGTDQAGVKQSAGFYFIKLTIQQGNNTKELTKKVLLK